MNSCRRGPKVVFLSGVLSVEFVFTMGLDPQLCSYSSGHQFCSSFLVISYVNGDTNVLVTNTTHPLRVVRKGDWFWAGQ